MSAALRAEPLAAAQVKIATWNLDWLIAPAAFKELKEHCVPRDAPVAAQERSVPCDVARKFQRSARDFAALAGYARKLNADVVALQEVDGPDAARLVFHGYEFCFTGRAHPQNNGFAIRAGLPYRCGRDLRGLSLGDTLRRGAELILYPGEPQELRLLNVHLKSGCRSAALNGPEKACAELARQLPALRAWIEAQARAGRPYVPLGDFNRDLLRDRGPARGVGGEPLHVWSALDDSDPPGTRLINVADQVPFRNCVPGQAFTGYIDYIVLSCSARSALLPGSFQRLTYTPVDARHAKLSDHCPVAVGLALRQTKLDGSTPAQAGCPRP